MDADSTLVMVLIAIRGRHTGESPALLSRDSPEWSVTRLGTTVAVVPPPIPVSRFGYFQILLGSRMSKLMPDSVESSHSIA